MNFSSEIMCDQVRSLSLFCDHLMLHKAKSILKDLEHALYGEVELLPHGRGFRSLVYKTNRRGNSFVPSAVRLLNRVMISSFYQYLPVITGAFQFFFFLEPVLLPSNCTVQKV